MMVVSLDRIGSEYGYWKDRKTDEELNELLVDFILKWKINKKLANARKILDTAFSRDLGDDEMDELEREFKDLQYWSMKNPKPPKNNKLKR